jgi:hypothetical protein
MTTSGTQAGALRPEGASPELNASLKVILFYKMLLPRQSWMNP